MFRDKYCGFLKDEPGDKEYPRDPWFLLPLLILQIDR